MKKTGFTLIELLIVVAIIAILAAIAVPNFLEAQIRSKVSRCKADMRTVAMGLESYRIDCNKFPPATMWDPMMEWGYNSYIYAVQLDGTPTCCIYLTTPVAYLTSLPIEPFTSGKLGQGNRKIYSYAYTNFETMSKVPWASTFGYPDGPGYGPSPELHLDYGSSTVNRTPYLLTGQGPDAQSYWPYISHSQCVGLKAMVMNTTFSIGSVKVSFNVYDPSNGTVSAGDIFRTQ